MDWSTRRKGRQSGLSVVAARVVAASVLVAAAILAASPAAAQWQIKSEDGNSSLKLGFLVQGRADWQKTEDVDAIGQAMYLRRARILLGGKVNPRVAFFLETDSPNLGRHSGTDPAKNFSSMYVQDFILTWTLRGTHMLDAGLLLTPDSYHHLQSAATLLAMDYAPYSFIEAGPLSANVGRDTGLELRGLFAENRVEYRAGMFQGYRKSANDSDAFRGMIRVAVHPFKTGSTAYFTHGTMLGKARTLSIGGTADFQKDYTAIHGDAFFEQPVSDGAATLQVDVAQYDGGDYIALPKQSTWLAEAGYAVKACKMGAFLQLTGRNYDDKAMTDLMSAQIGVVYRMDGHRENFKLGFTQISGNAPSGVDDPPKRTMIQAQYQVFYF
jgi:hypothetical protein